ncbi:MAG: hypothetical protein J3Q66DRAFT_416011 [Benniella sp.]|nr:MAG: hypothetical protein J3Q66DRAFT_416011 [Benniella sp.]
MYSYPPRVPFNYVAKDVLHPAEQASCANVDYVPLPYNVQDDPNMVGVHAAQAYIPTHALQIDPPQLSNIPSMPPITSIPFGPQFQVPVDLQPQPFPPSSRVDGLALGTQASPLAVAHHDTLDVRIDMAESPQDLSGYLSISQHLSAVQHDILHTDNPDFVLVPTSIETDCYSFVPTSIQTHGTNQAIITRPRHPSMPAWFPNGYGSQVTPMATPLVRSMSSMASMQTTSHATGDALFSNNETFSVSSRNTIQATMLDVDSVVSSAEMNSQSRETTSLLQVQYTSSLEQSFGPPSTVTSGMPTTVSLTLPTPFHRQDRLRLTLHPISIESQTNSDSSISSSPVSVLSSSSSSSSPSSSSSLTTWRPAGPIRRDRKVIGSRSQKKQHIQFSAITEFPIKTPLDSSTKSSSSLSGTSTSTNDALPGPNNGALKMFHWTPESFQERDYKPGDEIPKRPPNSFMLYRKDQCPGKSSGSNPTGVSGSQISIDSGQSWGGMTDDQKMHYRKLSEETRARFMAANPWYRFTRGKGSRQNGKVRKRKGKGKGKGKAKKKEVEVEDEDEDEDEDEKGSIGKIKEEDMDIGTSESESTRRSDAWSLAGAATATATASTDEEKDNVLDNSDGEQTP